MARKVTSTFAIPTPLPKTESDEDKEMADPFEVRMRFTSQLQHLSASITAAQKAASFALKNREMDEDLHSCIVEQLERVCIQSFPPSMQQIDKVSRVP
jgi:hypothetical protein